MFHVNNMSKNAAVEHLFQTITNFILIHAIVISWKIDVIWLLIIF